MAKFHDKFWNRDGSAKRCFVCRSPDLVNNTIDHVEWTVCESETICGRCDTVLDYWSFGSYCKDWLRETEEELLKIRKWRLGK